MSKLTRYLPVLGATAALGIGGASANALAGTEHHSTREAGQAQTEHHYSAWDKQWLQTSIEGDLFEIAGGQMAQRHASSQAVKDYGARLVTDHTQSLNESIALAKEMGVPVPKAPTQEQQALLELLDRFTGSDFDKLYADVETKDHQQDISEAKDEVNDGSNGDFRKAAAKELPTLQEHLKIAEQLGGRPATEPLPG
jgi:putative membrane protein